MIECMRRTHQRDADCVEKLGVKLDYGGLQSDNSFVALLQTCAYTLNHEHTHLKHNAMHTQPPNASIIQTQSYSACFACFFLSHIPFAWLLSWEQQRRAREFHSGLFICPLSISRLRHLVGADSPNQPRPVIVFIYVPILFIYKCGVCSGLLKKHVTLCTCFLCWRS